MFKKSYCIFMLTCAAGSAMADPGKTLDDTELGAITGQNGISFATNVALNQVYQGSSTTQSRLALGFTGTDGKTNYLVFKRPHGVLGIYGLTLDVKNRTDGGGSYCEIGLPSTLSFNDVGFDSLNAQTTSAVQQTPFNQTLGSLSINGRLSMTGQLRVWAN